VSAVAGGATRLVMRTSGIGTPVDVSVTSLTASKPEAA
jgi:hypothetical protein